MFSQPTISNAAGQCIMTKIDTSTMDDEQKSKLTKNWKLQYSRSGTSGEKQSCKCAADNTYISADKNVFSTQFGSPINNSVYYSCADSTPVAIQDNGASTVQLDKTQQGKLIRSTFDYYKSVCKNKSLSEELHNSLSTNESGDQKYEDMKTFYNYEYLTRINLGIGILITTGLMYFTLNTKAIVPLPT